MEYARTRFTSFITKPIEAANMAVKPPIMATMGIITSGEAWNTGKNRATRNTPAVTIVAA